MPVGRQVLSPSKVAAGQRDKPVQIQSKTDSSASSGFPVEGWPTLATVYMSREDVRADERAAAGMDTAFVETQWQMPYMAAMDPELVDVPATKRLVYRNRVYNIRAAALMDRRQGIELLTLAGVMVNP